MKMMNHKTLGLAALLVSGIPSAFAANESTGYAIGDTTIFSLFLLAAVVFLLIIYAQISALKGILENKDLWTKNKKSNGNGEKAAVIVAGLIISQSLFAQDGSTEPLVAMTDQMYWILIALDGFLLGIVITLYYVLKGLVSSLRGEEEQEEIDVVSTITASLTDAVPIEEESSILLDHDYDGIKELDNNLPPWWKYGFYLTIIVAFAYIINFHVIGTGQLQIEEYESEMEEARIEKEAYMATQANLVDESNLTLIEDAGRLESGKEIFVGNCQVCHGAGGEGVVGPNLTDEYWKHGGGIANVYNLIKVGVPDKGMISWESQLTPGQIHEVASYILTLQGTNPPNAKAPEGEIWKEEVAAATDTSSTSEEIIEQEVAAEKGE